MRKTFSITDEDALNKLNNMENQSRYIQKLITQDITRGVTDEYNAGILHTLTLFEQCLAKIREDILPK